MGVEINNGIEMVYQCHCPITGRRMRESCDDMGMFVYGLTITTWVTNKVGRERERERER